MSANKKIHGRDTSLVYPSRPGIVVAVELNGEIGGGVVRYGVSTSPTMPNSFVTIPPQFVLLHIE